MNLISTDILNIVLGAAFILFCILMLFQIKSEIDSARSSIIKGYETANIVHSAQFFKRTGIDFMRDIDYFEFENNQHRSKLENQQQKMALVDDINLEI